MKPIIFIIIVVILILFGYFLFNSNLAEKFKYNIFPRIKGFFSNPEANQDYKKIYITDGCRYFSGDFICDTECYIRGREYINYVCRGTNLICKCGN